MRKIAFVLFVPFALGACADYSKDLPTQELRDLKPACSAGDMSVCSDIAHKVRRQQAEADYLAKAAE